MTKTITPGKELDNLDNSVVEDLLATSDSEFLEEIMASGIDPHIAADRIRKIVEQGHNLAAKSKWRAAKAAAASNQAASVRVRPLVDSARARQLLRELSANDPEFQKKVTLAARNEEDLSDEDILGIIDDLRELGVIRDEDDAK